jgi:hypothetical protein
VYEQPHGLYLRILLVDRKQSLLEDDGRILTPGSGLGAVFRLYAILLHPERESASRIGDARMLNIVAKRGGPLAVGMWCVINMHDAKSLENWAYADKSTGVKKQEMVSQRLPEIGCTRPVYNARSPAGPL